MIPNTPSLIGYGMNPHCVGKHLPPSDLTLVDELWALSKQLPGRTPGYQLPDLDPPQVSQTKS